MKILAAFAAAFVLAIQPAAASAPPVDHYEVGRITELTWLESDPEYRQETAEVTVELRSGEQIKITQSELATDARQRLQLGKEVIVAYPAESSAVIAEPYRLPGMLWLLAAFAAFVVAVLRLPGLRALAGLGLSVLAIWFVLIPLLQAGYSPLAVVAGTASLIAAASLLISHGFRATSWLAIAGILVCVLITFGLAEFAVHFVQLTGSGSEDAFNLQLFGELAVDLRGLLLGGILIGALGVLDDAATAQAVAVEELKCADPKFGPRQLFARAMAIGTAHSASLVNTLVLAYAGASLPLLMLLQSGGSPLWVAISSGSIAEEIIRTLIGSAAILLAIPLTTLLAALYFGRPGVQVKHSHGGHGHSHSH